MRFCFSKGAIVESYKSEKCSLLAKQEEMKKEIKKIYNHSFLSKQEVCISLSIKKCYMIESTTQ
jgi:hypothetical protein